MHSRTGLVSVLLALGFLFLTASARMVGQNPKAEVEAAQPIPEAPMPQLETMIASAALAGGEQQTQGAAAGSSSSQNGQQPTDAEKTQHAKAEDQLKEQERQRTLGIVPAFNISYRPDAVSLTAGQKMRLAFRSSVDPVTFAAGFLVAGYHEVLDDDPGFGWGAAGYGKRAGAAYLDAFNGTMIGNGILPALLHQDPRYFRLGHGTKVHRVLYALYTNVACKHDNTHKWEPNYSNVAGNILSGAISNLYYPAQDSGIGETFSNGMIVTAEGGLGSLFQEFWPDISRKFLHKDPTHGLDAEARALDAKEKQDAQEKAKKSQQ